MKNKPILTPFLPVNRSGFPVQVAVLTYGLHVALIEIVQAPWKERTNTMGIRHEWRVMHMTNHQGNYDRNGEDEVPMVARSGATLPTHRHGDVSTAVLAKREAVEAAREFLGITVALTIVGDEPEEEDEEATA